VLIYSKCRSDECVLQHLGSPKPSLLPGRVYMRGTGNIEQASNSSTAIASFAVDNFYN
jgi:hypothetical protein